MMGLNHVESEERHRLQIPPSLFDLCALQIAEANYRDELQTHPDNTATRLNLAWCLFMQAVHSSGRESACPSADNLPTTHTEKCCKSTDQRSSQALLQECLGHTFMVRNLCIHKKDFQDAARLQALVRLSGLHDAAKNAEAQSMERLAKLSWEIMHGTDSVS